MRNWEFPPPKKMEVKRAVFEKCKHSRGGGGGALNNENKNCH